MAKKPTKRKKTFGEGIIEDLRDLNKRAKRGETIVTHVVKAKRKVKVPRMWVLRYRDYGDRRRWMAEVETCRDFLERRLNDFPSVQDAHIIELPGGTVEI